MSTLWRITLPSKYNFVDPARPVDFKASSIVAALKKGPLTAMPKADGVRCHIIINDSAELFIRSRADLPFPALKEIEEYLNREWLLDYRVDLAGTTIEGELVYIDPQGNESRCEVTSGALQRHDQMHRGRVKFYHFDTHDKDVIKGGKVERLTHKRWIIQNLIGYAFKFDSLRTFTVTSLEELMEFYETCRRNSFEGAVAVRADAPYTSGKRVGAGWKVKPEVTVEGTIVGLREAHTEEGKPLGRVGSFIVDFEDGTQGEPSAGSMGHGERRHCWENPEETIGRIAEFKAMEKFEKGGYRHAGWKLWRDTLENKGVKQ